MMTYRTFFSHLQFFVDVDTSLLTILSYSSNSTKSSGVEKMVSGHLCSLKDYFFHRKLKATPFIDLKLPSKHHAYRGFEVLSSSDDEDDNNIFQQKFLQLHPEERSAVIQKSESILKLSPSKLSSRQRTLSDNMSLKDLSGSDRSRPRSLTHPHSNNSTQEPHSQDNNNIVKSASSDMVLKDDGANISEIDGKAEIFDQLIQNHQPPSPLVSPEVVDESLSEISDLSESSSQEKEDHHGTGNIYMYSIVLVKVICFGQREQDHYMRVEMMVAFCCSSFYNPTTLN